MVENTHEPFVPPSYEALREAIMQPEGNPEIDPDALISTEEEVWNVLLVAYRKLKASKPDDRSERARRYAVTITEYEKMLSYFNTMVWEGLDA